ncbi:MAG: outer membrane protein assembly factor BamA [Sulfurimonas sp.]|nr:outer membrane protein assembly factor BamA [Sulfurimonas sp.]
MRIFLATLLTLLTINLSAMTIKSIDYVGMVHISKPVALRMLEFDIGDNVDIDAIDESIKKYFKQGYFDDVWAEFDNGKLTFHFKEKAIISKVELKGWKESDKDILDTVIQIKKGSLYDKKRLQAAKKRIQEAIAQSGKIDSVIEVEEEVLDNGSIKITFIVNEGEKIVIQKIDYSGVLGLDSDLFNDVIANKEKQFMGWFWGRNDGEMKLLDLSYDPLRIRDLYMQYGYLDSKVDEPFTRVNFDHYTAGMSYQIEEGEVYNISGISINQVEHVIDEEKIREIISLEKGKAFNIKTFRDDAEKIKTLIADLSYAFVQVVPDLKKNKDDHTVEVVFKITPGDKVKIRNVIISGNNRTLDRIIRRELYLGPGDMYSLTDLKDSRNSLGRMGFFDGNTIEEKRVDNSTMDLVVKVKEAPTGNIQLGGGYGSYGGLLVTVAVNDRNIWGSGIDMGVQAEKSERTQNYSFNISNPRLNDSDFSGNFSIFKSFYEYNDYSVDSQGLSFGIGHRFTRYISGYIGYSFSDNSYSDINTDTTLLDPKYFESYSKSSVILNVKFDNTDDYYLPREGYTMSQSVEKAGVGGDADFIKSRTNFEKFTGLEEYIGFDAIFRYKARYYYVADTGYLPIADKFYMGGMGSVRGYESYSISPTETRTDGSIARIGAKQTFSNNVEVSFPLVPKAKMRLVTYLDWGFIGDGSLDEYSRGGYGVGLEWFSPVGPIQLMFSKPLAQEQGDKTTAFEFSMGQRF